MPEGYNLGTAFAAITLDASGIAAGMAKAKSSIADGAQQIGQSLTSIGSGMTTLGAPFLAFGALAVKAFTDSQDALAQLDARLKSTSAHNGEFTTTTAASADELANLTDELSTATDRLSNMQTVYNSNTEHTVAQTLALDNQKKKVAELTSALAAGNVQTTTQINVTHMSRDALIALSKALQNTTKFSDETVQSAEAMLLTFTNIGENIFPEVTKTVLDMSEALGQDTKSSAIQLGKALQDPIAGLTALKRVGVAFTDSQKEMITQLVKAGKVEEAQKLILKELQTEFGGAAVAAGKTFSGQLARVQNQLKDVMEGIGEKLIPVVTSLVNHIVDLANWFTNLNPHLQDIIIGIGVFMASLAIIGPIIAAIGIGITALGSILAGVGTIIGVLMGPIGLLIAGGALLVYVFRDQIGGALSVFFGYLEQGKGVFTSFGAALVALFGSNPITDWLTTALTGIQSFLDNWKLNWSLIVLFTEYYIQGVVTAIQKVIGKVQEWISQNPELAAALVLIGGAVIVVTGILAAVPIVLGLISTAAGILTGVLGLLLSPIVLLTAGIAGILFITNALYPGGLGKMFHDAAVSAKELADILTGVANNAILAAANALANLMAIGQGIANGTFTPGQVLGAVGNEISSNAGNSARADALMANYAASLNTGGLVPIPPVGGGSGAAPSQPGFGQPNSGASIVHNGDVHINANSHAEGAAAANGWADQLEARYRGRGNG